MQQLDRIRKAFIFQGGWQGHEPTLVSERFRVALEKNGYQVTVWETLDGLLDEERLFEQDLLVFCWTGVPGDLGAEHTKNLIKAVGQGAGLAGCHGGMCDAFRDNVEWQFMTGGQWVSHPGGDNVTYMVNICHGSSPITEGLTDFQVCSEHYYLHVDPAIEVLATTRFPLVPFYHLANKPVDMPVAWTKYWGNGRVFYSSLGHHNDVFDQSPQAWLLMERGLLWAGDGKQVAIDNHLTTQRFEMEKPV